MIVKLQQRTSPGVVARTVVRPDSCGHIKLGCSNCEPDVVHFHLYLTVWNKKKLYDITQLPILLPHELP